MSDDRAGRVRPVWSVSSPGAATLDLWLWRHPRPRGVAGRCIGRTDVRVDPRRAKRLAHRIRAAQRRHGGPAEIWTSPLRRCADVAAWLARWGWTVRTDAALLELDFGAWDGRPWSAVPWSAVAAWEADFAGHAPGGGESLQAMALRLDGWVRSFAAAGTDGGARRWVVAHAGAMRLLQRRADGLPATVERAADWPAPPRYARLMRVPISGQPGT
ncbi:MAG: hypothetical protein RIQ53_1357 [Pseudomonadota bacterium]|jgi:alpha-ribazole phosphatase